MNKTQKRLKIIPDRIFHKIWNISADCREDDYISNALSDKNFPFKKYGLDYVEAADVLKKIYKYKHASFKDILDKTGYKKSEISHIFCIPIRTIEDWYNGNSNPPAYILLIMLKYFHLFSLGKYIRLQSSIDFYASRPAIYEKRKTNDPVEEVVDTYQEPFDYYREFMESEDYERYLDKLVADAKKKRHAPGE